MNATSRPNEHGVYVQDLEMLEHIGKKSKATVILAYCEDEAWRFGWDILLRDAFHTSSGSGGLPSRKNEPFEDRGECIAAASSFLRKRLEHERPRNPRAVEEIEAWLDELAPKREEQLFLFEPEQEPEAVR